MQVGITLIAKLSKSSWFLSIRLTKIAGFLSPAFCKLFLFHVTQLTCSVLVSLQFWKQHIKARSRALQGRLVSSKGPSRLPDRGKGVARRNRSE